MKKVFLRALSFLSLLFTFQTGNAQIKDIEFGSENTLDILTWNIEHFPKAGPLTIDSLIKIIANLKPEIIAMQEISDTSAFKEMLKELPQYGTHFKSVWYAGLGYAFNTETVTIKKAYEIYKEEEYWRPFPRSPQVLEFDYQGDEYILINNHFKCCGDGYLDLSEQDDQERRRLRASKLLKDYCDDNFPNKRIIITGDLNDEISDDRENNVFNPFLDDPEHYIFADSHIEEESAASWSYPSWPSHLDHFIVSDELFSALNYQHSEVSTIIVDDYFFNGFFEYDVLISDHRPVGLSLGSIETDVTDIDDTFEAQINIYPNPSSQSVEVQLEDKAMIEKVELYSSSGKKLLSQFPKNNLFKMDVSSFPTDLYFIKVLSRNKLYIEKIIVLK